MSDIMNSAFFSIALNFNVEIALCLVMVAMFSCVEETAQLCFCAVEMNANLWFSWCREGHCFYVGARLELVALPKPHTPPQYNPSPHAIRRRQPGVTLELVPIEAPAMLEYICHITVLFSFLFSCFYLYDTLT